MEAHLASYRALDCPCLHIEVEAIDDQQSRLVLDQMEIGQKLHETLVVLAVFELYFPQSFDGHLTIDAEDHF